jgi:hypothetical protein
MRGNLAGWSTVGVERARVKRLLGRRLACFGFGGGWAPWVGIAFGPLAEIVVQLATPDAEEVLAAAEHEVAVTEQYASRPALLRACALCCSSVRTNSMRH